MAKRMFSSVLSFLLFISTSGVGLHLHKCSQEGMLLSFFSNPKCVCFENSDDKECTAESVCCAVDFSLENNDSDEKSCCEEDFLLIINEAEQTRNQHTVISSDLTDFAVDSWLSGEVFKALELYCSKYYTPGKAPPLFVNRYLVYCSLLC